MEEPSRSRFLWPWLHAIGLGLVVSYAVLWQVEFYLFIMALLAGGLLFSMTFIGLVTFRLIKRRTPVIDVPGIILLAVMILAHVVAFAFVRTVNWC